MHPWSRDPRGRPRKGDVTRERLFDAAMAEFREVGFGEAGIARIADRAGTSRASFYSHYPCKEAVLLELQWRIEAEILERTRRLTSLREFLVALVDAMIDAETSLGSDDLLRHMLSLYLRGPSPVQRPSDPNPLFLEVGRRFAEARSTELRPGLEPAQAAHLFLGSLFGLLAGSAESLRSQRSDLLQLSRLFLREPVARALARSRG